MPFLTYQRNVSAPIASLKADKFPALAPTFFSTILNTSAKIHNLLMPNHLLDRTHYLVLTCSRLQVSSLLNC